MSGRISSSHAFTAFSVAGPARKSSCEKSKNFGTAPTALQLAAASRRRTASSGSSPIFRPSRKQVPTAEKTSWPSRASSAISPPAPHIGSSGWPLRTAIRSFLDGASSAGTDAQAAGSRRRASAILNGLSAPDEGVELLGGERRGRADGAVLVDVGGILHAAQRRGDAGRRPDELEAPLGVGLEAREL